MTNQQNNAAGASSLAEIRRQKLDELVSRGENPFLITKYDVTHHSEEIKSSFDDLNGKSVSVAGRLMSKRVMGKASFCHVQDLQGSILAVGIGRQCSRIFFPVLSIGSQRDLSQQLWILSPALRFNEGNANLLVLTMVAEE